MAGLDDAASELESIARHLRRAGDLELVRDLTRAMRHAADGIPDTIRGGLQPHLPNRYARDDLGPDLRLTVNVRTGERDPGVAIRGSTISGKRRKLRRLDNGIIEHPLWGDRNHWRKQAVTPGWFTGPCEEATPAVRAAVDQALQDISDRATRKGP